MEDDDLPFYVGKGKNKRAYEHLMPSHYGVNAHKDNKIKKAVKENKNVCVEFIISDMNESDALLLEAYYIAAYGRDDLGLGLLTNKTDGGDKGNTGMIHSDETKQKISKAHLGRKHTEETRRKVSEAGKGRKGPPMTPEHKKLMSETHAGIPLTDDHRDALSMQWLVIHPDGTEESIINLQRFCDANKLDSPTMRRIADGVIGYKQHKGYRCARLQPAKRRPSVVRVEQTA